MIHPPDRHRASDQVSLKLEVWDEAGNRLEQVTRDACTLQDLTGQPGSPQLS